jgi:hypothetical protein
MPKSNPQRCLWIFLLIFYGLSGCLPLSAQTTFGSITGTVTDPTAAVIPNVPVSVTNEGTGLVRSVTTAATGTFNISNLAAGAYRLRIEATGFGLFEEKGLVLGANQVLNVDAQLTVASATPIVVDVSGAVGVIDTQTSTLAYNKTNSFMEQLPVVSRSGADVGVFGFVYTNPGVSKGGQGNPTVNGGRMLDTTLSLDGVGVGAYASGMGGGPTQPSLEAIQEVNVSLAGTAPEFARSANITVVTKSGSNSFHGAAYYNYNGNKLNARDFYNASVPFRVYHDFAGALGGPIRKNKLFFFVTYDGSREGATVPKIGNVPLPAWRTGDFGTTRITDPVTNAPFPDNRIPANRISPVALKVQDIFFPLPNSGAPGLLSNNWRGDRIANTGYTHFDTYSGRVDYNLSAKDLFFARYNYRKSLRTADTWPAAASYEYRPTQGAVASWTHSFSPTVLNELRGGFIRNYDRTDPVMIGSDILNQVGLLGVGTAGLANPPGFVVNGIVSTNIGGSGAIGGSNANLGIDTNFQVTENLSVTHGAHFLKFGFDYGYDQVSGYSEPTSIYGTYNFNGSYTGLGYADFLLGIPQTTALALPIPETYLRGRQYSWYAQDQFKASRRLTLNYGIRYEILTPYNDIRGNIYSYDPASKALIVPDVGLRNVNPFYPKNLPIVTASKAGFPSDSLMKTVHNRFYPRFGVAYKPFKSDKTVIRGGYGIYGNTVYAALTLNDMVGGPFSGSETYTNRLTSGVPLFAFPRPFLASGSTGTQNTFGINPNITPPYTQQYTLTLEQQIGQIGLRVGYVGTRSVGLIYTRNLNQPQPSLIPYTASRAYADPLYNQISYLENGGTQQYNGLQISVQKSAGRSVTFNNGFTWARDLTDTPPISAAKPEGPQIQNQFCRRCERGPNPITKRLRAYVNAVVDLPVGRNHRFLGNATPVVDAILGGWNMSWVAEMQTGMFYTPSFTGSDPSNTNTIGGRPDVIGDPTTPSPGRVFNPAAFSVPGCPTPNPVCSSPAPVGRFGNVGVSTLVGPDLVNWNLALSKSFAIRENMRLRFRALAVNAFNHPNFANPAASISAPTAAGILTTTFGEQLGERSRQVHLSVRLEF